MLNSHWVIIGALIAFAGTSRYIFDTLRGHTQPNRVSWIMWTLAPMIAFAAELNKSVGLQSLTTFMAGFCPLLVLIASFVSRRATWKLTTFDIVCGFLSVVGLILWLLSGQGNVAIIFSIAADALAALPTIKKAYSYPQSETWQGFLAAAINAFITLLTIKDWTFATYGFPVYLVVCCLLMVYLIKFRPQTRKLQLKLQS